MNENDFFAADDHTRGSAWAALDEAFFELVDGLFSRGFAVLAEGMLAANDNDLTADRKAARAVDLPEQTGPDSAQAAARRAAMRRHPSARRRF